MGISAKPIGKFQSIMRKIKNQKDAELYTIKHSTDPKPKKEKQSNGDD